MTFEEFETWQQHCEISIPELSSWFDRQDNPEAILKLWRDLLSGVSLADAIAAITGILAGTVERPDFGQWSRIPAIVLDFGKQQRNKAAEARRVHQARDNGDRWQGDGESCVEAFERIERERWGGPPRWSNEARRRRRQYKPLPNVPQIEFRKAEP